MKKIILALVLVLSCIDILHASKVAVYSIPLTRVELMQADSITAAPITMLASDTDGHLRSQYEDNNIQIIWKCNGVRFWFVLLNKTNFPITIDWDKITFVDIEGEIGNVIHTGIKYNERNNGQLKSIVPKLAKINDFLVPSKSCFLRPAGYFTAGGWDESYLFPCIYKNKKELKKGAPSYVGKTMRIEFPITIGNTEYNYTFYFELAELINGDK